MKYYIVAWDYYYPEGGLRNIKDTCSDLETARQEAQRYLSFDRVDIYNSELEREETIK
jgi:hypothetical protein